MTLPYLLLFVAGVLLLLLAGFVIGVLVLLWAMRALRVTAVDDETKEALRWVASPHGPLRAPTDAERQWASEHPGEQLGYIPGHPESDPYLQKGGQ